MTHPIVLPPHIEIKLIDEAPRFRDGGAARERWLIQRAAQLGADQELGQCIAWLDFNYPSVNTGALRSDRRPKPPSLKQQALEALDEMNRPLGTVTASRVDIIRHALESLPDPQD